MRNIQKELELAREELAALEHANKEAAIAAAFKRTASRNVKHSLKAAYKKMWEAGERVQAQQKVAMAAFHNISGEWGTREWIDLYNEYYVESNRESSLRMKADEAAKAVLDILESYEPVVLDTEAAEEKVAALVAQMSKPECQPKRMYESLTERLMRYHAKYQAEYAKADAKIDLLRSRVAAAQTVVPGEARNMSRWHGFEFASDEEAAETLAWLNDKANSARNPRRRGDRRNCLTQLDWAHINNGGGFPSGKVGRYWAERHDYWFEGREARNRAAEAAASGDWS